VVGGGEGGLGRRRPVRSGSGRGKSGAGAARPYLRRSKLKRIKILGPAREGDDRYVTGAGEVGCKSN
jgi:hypothetical protein